MKIGILTQPLRANYGGVLQNYALQQVLKGLGYEPETLEKDYHRKTTFFCILSIPKRIVTKYILKRRKYIFSEKHHNNIEKELRAKLLPFINKYISRSLLKNWEEINLSQFGGLIVGSDQVWRPLYNWGNLDKMFLSFVPADYSIKRIAYAASFGSSEWEYTDEQTATCRELAQRFDAISVREDSGGILCKEHLNVDATLVLDPTLLLNKEHYDTLCIDIPKEKGYLCAYILDQTDEDKIKLKEIASSKDLKLKICSADNDCTLSMEQWLAMFRDAEMVITNSFHGTVFSIIFNKDFYSITHPIRGGCRIPSLFRQLDISQSRIATDLSQILVNNTTPLDWDAINTRISKLQQHSITFLQNALTK